jgi:hypothetical protein
MAAGPLDQSDVEDQLYAATVLNGLVADDGACRCWATIRSGLGAGLQEPAGGLRPGFGLRLRLGLRLVLLGLVLLFEAALPLQRCLMQSSNSGLRCSDSLLRRHQPQYRD